MNETIRWLDRVRGNDSIREVARKVGTTHATLNRQARDDAMSYELVLAIARKYHRPVLVDLLALGLLAPQDLGVDDVDNVLSTATDEQLIVEVGKRLGITNASALFDAPISAAVGMAGELINGRFGVGPDAEDYDEDAEAAGETDVEHEEDTVDKYDA